jgi:DNA-binding transcriptional LysR family regulator
MNVLSSLDSLRYFLAAARALNFRHAARSVALTPTAFGQRIKQLEEQLGTKLFVRTTRSVTLTEPGLALVPAAEQCVAAADVCARVGSSDRESLEMELTLGTRQELGMSWVMPQRRVLARERPWLTVHLYFGSGPDLLLRVRNHEIDCAITSSRVGDRKLESLQLQKESYVFVGARTLLAKTPLRQPEDAALHTLVDSTGEMPLYRYFRDAPGGGDSLRFRRGLWLGSIAAIRDEVLAGVGVAVLPEYLVKRDLASGKLQRVLPKVPLLHDYFRLVFRATDPRRAVFETLAADFRRAPLR